jgi:HAD superfamily hydrolase (TIGR01509 family)
MPTVVPIRGVIFDLDGTLVDSGLDFDLMRLEMQLPPGMMILEAMAQLSEPRASECREILARHEWEGAERATLMPGVVEFLAQLEERGIRRAVLTRNGRKVALATLNRLGLRFDPVVAREDAPAKPDPTAVWEICKNWGMTPEQVAIVGDFYLDMETGRRGGIRTVLYTAQNEPRDVKGFDLADHCLRCFQQSDELLKWLAEPT